MIILSINYRLTDNLIITIEEKHLLIDDTDPSTPVDDTPTEDSVMSTGENIPPTVILLFSHL